MRYQLLTGVSFFSGCLACFLFQKTLNLHPVPAAALVGVLASFLRGPYHAVIYAGAFAGMCSPQLLTGIPEVVGLSIFGAGFFVLLRPYGNGLGGRLGSMAFFGGVVFMVAKKLW